MNASLFQTLCPPDCSSFASLGAFLLQPTNIFRELLFVFLDARGTNCCTTDEDITKMLPICSLVALQCRVPLYCRGLKVSETFIRKRENCWTIHNNTGFDQVQIFTGRLLQILQQLIFKTKCKCCNNADEGGGGGGLSNRKIIR